jgi:hypothetical protein
MISPIPPAYSISKAKPVVFENKVPGPGEYNSDNIFKSNPCTFSFSRSPRKLHDLYQVPGVGLYSPNDMRKSSGYSISRSPRILSNVRITSPGPGDYNYQFFEKRYQYSISKARRSYNSTLVPGPGSYTPNIDSTFESSPRVQFAKQPRMPRDHFLTPAPGQYEISRQRQSGYTIPKASGKSKISDTPGPGNYQTPQLIGYASLKSKL